jgi:hypothetical protein
VFPNVGFTIATINIGKSLQSEGIKWVGSIMTILVVITYLFVGVYHVKAFICWPGKDEDTYAKEGHHKEDLSIQTRRWLGVGDVDVERNEKSE